MTAMPPLSLELSPMSVLHCPSHLTADTRVAFRTQALAALDATLTANEATVALDFSAVVDIDASGLGVLILLQKRAREHRVRVSLVNVPGPVERLLDETRMSALFEIVRHA